MSVRQNYLEIRKHNIYYFVFIILHFSIKDEF